MPRVKQPHSLEDISLHGFGRCIQTLAYEGRDYQQAGWNSLYEFLYASLPWCFRDKVACQILRSVSRACGEANLKECSTAMVKLIEVACRLNLRVVDFSAWPIFVQNVLLENVHRLDQMEILNTGREYSIFYIGNKVEQLLKVVGDNCPKLEHLEVHYCVSEKSVRPLLQCRHLRVLVLRSINIDVAACHQLLTGLQHLETVEIVTPKYESNVVKALKAIHRSNGQLPSLRSLTIHIAKQKHLKVVHAACPRLEKLGLILSSSYKTDSVPFKPVAITDLSLQFSCKVYNSSKKFRKLLGAIGLNLSSLNLDCVTHCSVNLLELSHLCPNLRRMTLVCYRCMDVPRTATLFRHLEHLDIDQKDYNTLFLEPILRSCPNITSLAVRFGQFTHCFYNVERIVISDTIISNILRVNSLACLEEFVVRGESRLTVETVRMLMESCPNLRKLIINDVWHMSQEELTSFKQQLQENNLDLGVYYFKYIGSDRTYNSEP
ncbi:F-box/LRR-repeat protein fbxl-1 [Anabrus simplex]|uniref:F-box/LRR-repeat protein fbxl-1 n=1 Tax=Anabrus simplex TaxID=316456 RepID=UPI0034DD9829